MNNHFWSKTVGGLLLIAAGVGFALHLAGIITLDIRQLITDYWPLLLIAVGLKSLLDFRSYREGGYAPLLWGLLPLAFGLIFLNRNFGWLPELEVKDAVKFLIPALLILTGLQLLARPGRKRKQEEEREPEPYVPLEWEPYSGRPADTDERGFDGSPRDFGQEAPPSHQANGSAFRADDPRHRADVPPVREDEPHREEDESYREDDRWAATKREWEAVKQEWKRNSREWKAEFKQQKEAWKQGRKDEQRERKANRHGGCGSHGWHDKDGSGGMESWFGGTGTASGGQENRHSFIGDTRIGRGRDPWELQSLNVSHFIGDIEIDLTRAHIPYGRTTIDVSVFIGDIKIYVPNDLQLEVSVQASSLIGDLIVFENKESGLMRSLRQETPHYRDADKKLRINVNLFIGDARVKRVG